MCTLTHATRRSQSDWSRSTLHEFEYVLVHITRRTLYTSTHNWTTHYSPQRSAKCQPVSLSSCLTSALTHVSRFTPSLDSQRNSLSSARTGFCYYTSYVTFSRLLLDCPLALLSQCEQAPYGDRTELQCNDLKRCIALPKSSHYHRMGGGGGLHIALQLTRSLTGDERNGEGALSSTRRSWDLDPAQHAVPTGSEKSRQ